MSATRDKTQKIGFVYTNLYELYKKGSQSHKSGQAVGTNSFVTTAKDELYFPSETTQVLKARDLEDLKKSAKIEIKPYVAPHLGANEAPKNDALMRLKDNLIKLQDIHARLRFMLQEINENAPKNPKVNGSSSDES